jgi:hypothetical protein
MSSTPEKVTFNGQVKSDETGYLKSGYDGFNWSDIGVVGREWLYNNGLDGTGWTNVLHGEADAYTFGGDATSFITSYVPTETFSLKSGIFANDGTDSTHSTDVFSSYTYSAGHGFALKASVTINLTGAASKINFGNYGDDFQHISAIGIYGLYRTVMDNVKVVFDGAIPYNHKAPRVGHLLSPAIVNHYLYNAERSPGHEAGVQDNHFHHVIPAPPLEHSGGLGLADHFSVPTMDHDLGP